MTADRDTREVFLGPTTQETDEFYAYQRDNPGKDKSEYLTWFEDKFGKEIELRRRRSDQPSDLEYMVIKKRSKYRERIGLESEKLLAYYEANPKKTYRELAAWFQKQFGKEIDITAISRMCASALKRNRNSADANGGDSPPDSSSGPPPAKRGRRSYGSANTSASSAGGPPQSSMPTFSVDISNRSHAESEGHTPKSRPETPQIPAEIAPFPDRMVQDGLKMEPKPQNPQPAVYPTRIRPAIPPESPTPLPQAATHPQTPMWNPVNPSPSNFAKGGKIAAKSERPSTVAPSPHKEPQPQISPARPNPPPRVLRSNSLTKCSAPPVIPVMNGNVPPPSEPSEFRQPIQRHPAEDEMNLEQLRTRLTDVVNRKTQLQDEMRALESEIANNEKSMQMRHYEMEVRRFHEVESSFRMETSRMQGEYEDLKSWNAEISRGNLQLQTIKQQLESDNIRLQEDNHAMAAEVQALSAKLEALREKMGQNKESFESRSTTPTVRQESVSNHGSSNEKAEVNSWLTTKFAKDAEKEEKLKRLVEDLTQAGWKDLEGKVQELVGFVNDMGTERKRQQEQWNTGILSNGMAPAAKANEGKQMTPPASTHCVTDETSASPPRSPLGERENGSSPKLESPRSGSPELKAAAEAAKAEVNSSMDTEMKD